MTLLHRTLSTLGRGLRGALVQLWRRLLTWLFNRRRRLFRRRWPHYVVFTLSGELRERAPQQPWYYSRLPWTSPTPSLQSLHRDLERVAADPDVRGVLFLTKGLSLSLAQAQSMGDLFARFRTRDAFWNSAQGRAAKQIVVFLEQAGNASFAMAAAADRVFVSPLTDWSVLGFHTEPTYLSDTLARVGVRFEVVQVAPWKTAFNTLQNNHMTEAEADQFNWLYDSLFTSLVETIARGRGLEASAVRALIDSAPLQPEEARAAGLIDGILYEDELPAALAPTPTEPNSADKPAAEARLTRFAQATPLLLRRLAPLAGPGRVGVITLAGTILPGKSRDLPLDLPLIGGKIMGSNTVQQQVRAALADDGLKAIVVHVDSGGGSALASDLMWRELTLLARKKPLVVHMGNAAASGGYYISAPAHRIVAQPTTLTGSIGVIIGKPITAEAYDKAQAHRYLLKRGHNADLLSDAAPWDVAQRQQVETMVQRSYQIFKERVADGRGLPVADLDPICNGRVWTGAQAAAHGLVDELGDFQRAVTLACELADLPTDGRVPVTAVQPQRPRLALSARALGLDEDPAELLRSGAALLRRDWTVLLHNEFIWLLADGLPRLP